MQWGAALKWKTPSNYLEWTEGSQFTFTEHPDTYSQYSLFAPVLTKHSNANRTGGTEKNPDEKQQKIRDEPEKPRDWASKPALFII